MEMATKASVSLEQLPPLIPPSAATKATKKSLQDLWNIRTLSVVIAIIHICITVGLMAMGFSTNLTGQSKYSETCVASAFLALITCVWTSTAAYETYQDTIPQFSKGQNSLASEDLAPWEWHNQKFVEGVTLGMLITVCQGPASLIYSIHLLGYSYWEYIKDQDGEHFSVIVAHLAIFIIIGIGSMVVVLILSRHISKCQAEAFGSAILIDEDEEEEVVPPFLLRSTWFIFFLDVAYLIDLSLIVSEVTGNSGPYLCIVIHVGSMMVTLWMMKRVMLDHEAIDMDIWMSNWRIWCLIHIFICFLLFLWSSLTLYVSDSGTDSFWSAMSDKEGSGLVKAELALFLIGFVVYSLWIFYHLRCMSTLDEIRTLKLMDQHNRSSSLPPLNPGPAMRSSEID